MLASIDPGDRIPEGFAIDESLEFAGKAIEEVARHRWLMAEELVLLLMMPRSLSIPYITLLPSSEAPLQVGKIYLISGDSKQSMFDGIEYEKRQTEDRANTQSGIYSQLSINKQQIIEGVYSTTSSSLRRRYYYMRDEHERFRKVVHYRYITESELQEATNRREGKKKTLNEGEEDIKAERKERKTTGRGSTGRSKRGHDKFTVDENDFGAVFDDEEEESGGVIGKSSLRRSTTNKANPNKTIPVHYSVLYNCYKYLFYKHLEMVSTRLPLRQNPNHTNTSTALTGLQLTYIKGEDEGGIGSAMTIHDAEYQYQDPSSNSQPISTLPFAIVQISPNNLTHHSLKYTQHCSVIVNGVLPSSSIGMTVDVWYEKVFQDPSMMLAGAIIPVEESRVRGVGKQLTENVFEVIITPALSAGRWRVAVLDQFNQALAFTQSEESLLTIIEESKAERFESLKRRRQKSKSEDFRRVDDTLPSTSNPINPPWPSNYPAFPGAVRLESENSTGMMTEAYSLLLSRGNSTEREGGAMAMQMQMDRTNSANNTRNFDGIASASGMMEGGGGFNPNSMQAFFVNRSWNVQYFGSGAPFNDMDYYSVSETDSLEVSSNGSYSANTTDGENGPDDAILEDGERDEIVRILEQGMSIEGENLDDGEVDRNHY